MNKEFYKNGKVYKIVDNTNGNIYIGSTCKTLSQRLAQHRSSFKRFQAGNGNNVKSYEILVNGDYEIILLEECKDITSKEQLHARERYYIDTLECLNKNIPGRKKNEYYEEKEYNKAYYEKNKNLLKEKRENKKDELKAKREARKEYQKEYYLNNKHKYTESNKKQYEKIKEMKKEFKKLKVV